MIPRPRAPLAVIRGVEPEEAQRRNRFERAHPEAQVCPVGEAWQAVLRFTRNEVIITRWTLGQLLDAAEEFYDPRGDRGG